MTLTIRDELQIAILNRCAEQNDEEPYWMFDSLEFQDAYYDRRARSLGYSDMNALSVDRERQMDACDHFGLIDGQSMRCTFCGEYCGP